MLPTVVRHCASVDAAQGCGAADDGDRATGKQKIDDLMEKAYGLTPCERRRCALGSEIRKFKERKGKYPKTLRGLGWFHFIPLRCPDTDQAYSYDSNTGQVSCSRCDAKKEQQKNKYRYKGRKSVGGGG